MIARAFPLVAACWLAAAAAAQPAERDPYTRGDAEAVRRAGYVSFGPFPFGLRGAQPVTSKDVEEHLGVPILWVETAHFRIGSSLATWRVPGERDTLRKIRAELSRLAERLPRVRPRARTLDPWLRLHLLAMRLEEFYAEVQHLLMVTDADFPRNESELLIGERPYMGQGPYLGQKGKYLVLVLQRASTLETYLRDFLGRRSRLGHRFHFAAILTLLYAVAAESDEGRLRHDTALHANLAFNVGHNLIDGFKGYGYDLPVWITAGLAHWFEGRVSPHFHTFDENEGSLADKRETRDWEHETRRLLAAGKGAPFAEVFGWRDYGRISFADHVLLWSRWEFLMSKGREPFARFLGAVKGRVDPRTWEPDPSDLLGVVRRALRDAYGLTPLTFDDAWRAWLAARSRRGSRR